MTRLLLAVTALALVGAGCGSAQDDPSLAEAAAKTEATGSSRFAVDGTDASGTQPVEITCIGEANYASERVHVRCDYGPSETVEMIAVGRVTYMRGSILGFAGAGEKWVKNEGDSVGTDLAPQHLLAMLRRASQSTERLGEEQVRSVETTHYRLVVDCEQAELDCESDTSSVDVWIDGDGVVRKIEVAEGDSPFTFEFYDFGAE